MDLEAVRAELEQVVRESVATIAVLEAEADDPDDELEPDLDPHPSEEESADLSEDDREEALIEAAQARSAEAEAALARLDAGTYGACIDCGEKIAEERLSFRPEAARCLPCQEKFEDLNS